MKPMGIHPDTLDIEREWGFAPPEGQEWPPEVRLTAQIILRQQSNPFFAAIMDTTRFVHNSEAGPDADADYFRMVGMVEVLTGMVVMYCYDQLGGFRDDEADPEERLLASNRNGRAVVGILLQEVSEQHGRIG